MGVLHIISCVVMLFVWAVTSQLLEHSYSQTCHVDTAGVTSVVLGNHGALNITFVFLCAGGTRRVPVFAHSSAVFPALLKPQANSPRDMCRFKDSPDGVTKRLLLFVERTFEIFVFGQIYCDISSEIPVSIQPYHSSCMTDSNGELTVTYLNPDTVTARTTVGCWNGQRDLGDVPSWLQKSFKSVYYDGGNRAYNSCVLNPWLKDTQFLDFTMERTGKSPLEFRLYCKGSPPETDAPVVRVHSYCLPDPDVLKIHVDNLDDEDVEFTLKCKRGDHVIKVNAGERTLADAVFSRDGVTDYPNNTCVLMTAPAKFGDRQYAVVLAAKEDGKHSTHLQVCHREIFPPFQEAYTYDTGCTADGLGNVPIRLYNHGPVAVTFAFDCFNGKVKVVLKSETGRTVSGRFFDEDAAVPPDICMFRSASDDGVEMVRLLIKESPTFFVGGSIYCDRGRTPPKRLLPYETDCHLDNNDLLSIRILNEGDSDMLYQVACFHGLHEFTVVANSTTSITAAMYSGEFKDYNRSCVFNPWVGKMQYLRLSTKRPGQNWLTYRITCRTEAEVDKPVVEVVTDCTPNTKGVLSVSMHNNDDETVKFKYSCYNGSFTRVLAPKTSGSFDVVVHQGEDYSYDPESCIFLADRFHDLLDVESQTLFVVAEKPTGIFSTWLISCPGSPAPFHVPGQYQTNCIPDAAGVVSVSLVNRGNHSLKYFLTCTNGVFQYDLAAGSVETVAAVFSEVDPKDKSTCQFDVGPDKLTQTLIVKIQDHGRLLFGNLHCDRRIIPPEPFLPYNTTCTPENGVISINVNNDADTPLNVKLVCRNGDVPLRLPPRTYQTVPAEFYSPSSQQPGACMFVPFPDSVDQRVYMASMRDGDLAPLHHFIECRNADRVGAPEPNVDYDCLENKDGTFTVTAQSHEPALVKLLTVCRGMEQPQALAAGGSLSITAAFFQGDGVTHPNVDCILLSLPPYYDDLTQALCVQAVLDEDFSAQYVFCQKDPKPTAITPEGPIVRLIPSCPESVAERAVLELRADVPAYASASCRNGDKQFTEVDRVSFNLFGRFDQAYKGDDCLFYKKTGSNTFTVEVEIGWGDQNSVLIQYQRLATVSCSYDDHGSAISPEQRVRTSFLAPIEVQTLRGGNSSANFTLTVTDVMDNPIDADHIAIGRKIRLRARDKSGLNESFRALSCQVSNGVTSYPILQAGCGDGMVFQKSDGFNTVGQEVTSPYFNAFKLVGDRTVRFSCRFVVCPTKHCDGNSCRNERRRKRSVKRDEYEDGISVISRPYHLL